MTGNYSPGVTGERDTRVLIAEGQFKWPCWKRVAHPPHHVEWVGDCPGVKVHPACMIARP